MPIHTSPRFRLSGGIGLAFLGGLAAMTPALQSQTLHDFGNPDGEEQLYIELINRARANPPAEGARLAASTDPFVLRAYAQYGVDLAMMQSEFDAIVPQPPLAPNASLTTAARGHTAWMLANATQSHYETNPANAPWDRVIAAGYSYSSMGESAYAYYTSTTHGHTGFQVDWGADDLGSSGGMQARRGHRVNNHSAIFREIGVGVLSGRNGGVGPQLVTQDFGYRTSAPSFGTGVVYYDLNGNDFYDAGEGVSGLTVNVVGADHYCTTAAGGGWVVPVPSAAATRAVTFSGLNVNHVANLVFPDSQNAKADLKLSYQPPTITSSASASSDSAHTLEFPAIAGATGYHWKRWKPSPATAENCETSANITASTTGNYSVPNTSVKQQGSASFHLQNSNGTSQSIELNDLYFGETSPSLSFWSRIRFATTSETFKVQVKEEADTTVWQDIFSQTGTNSAGESAFAHRSAPLSAMAGKAFRIRFLIDPGDRLHYSSTDNNYGWFIDAITLTHVSTLRNQETELLTGTSGSFTPVGGACLMAVAPVIAGKDFPAAYQTLNVPVSGFTLATSGTHGTVSGAGPYEEMTHATLSAAADPGYVFSGWTGDASGTTNPLSLLMDADKNVGVLFSPVEPPVDPFTLCFAGTSFELRVGHQVTFDLNRLLTSGETIKLKGKLPKGLKYNKSTGLISGTISGKAGTYQPSIQVLQGKTTVRTIAFPIPVLDFPSSLVGNFECILENADSTPCGAFKLTITKANRWSATLETAGAPKRRSAKGTFILAEDSPVAPITAVFPAASGAPPVTVNISIDGSSPNLTGTYDGGTLRGFRLASGAENPPSAATSSLVLDAGVQDGLTVPAGLGWLKGKVSTRGIAAFKGYLGDGTAARFTLRLSASGQAVLWAQPYKNKSSYIGGIVTLGDLGQTATGDPVLTDSVWWTKAAEAKTRSYPDGFPGMSVTLGTQRWTAPASASALGASLGWRDNHTAGVTINGAGLSNQAPQSTTVALPAELTLDAKFNLGPSAPSAVSPLADWKGKVSQKDGSISGTLKLPSGFSSEVPGGSATVSGVLFQGESWGTVTGCGLVMVPASGPKGSFRTAAFVLDQ